MKIMWIVQVKGKKCSKSWEISVVRNDYELGVESWGWFDENKLLVSHNGGPCNWPISEFVWDRQIDIAHALCAKLNEELNEESIKPIVKKPMTFIVR